MVSYRILDLAHPPSSTDIEIDLKSIMEGNSESVFVDNVLVYIAGYITRVITEKESCNLCYALLKDCKNTVSCELIDQKNRGGLVLPIVDVLQINKFVNMKCETM